MYSYKRWRHTRGFGVHSPYAYRFVENVVHPGRLYSYYGYSDIDATCGSEGFSRRVRREARMFLRFLVFMNPKSVYIPVGANAAFHAAANALGKTLHIERKPKNAEKCEILTSHRNFTPLETLCRHLAVSGHSITLIDAPEGWNEELFNALPSGLMIFGRHNTIVISREGMQKIAYEMSI